jgi:hypothetical protein
VRAIDDAGNVDSTPASYTWTVIDTSAPSSSITNPAGGMTLIAADFPYSITGTASDNFAVAGIEVSTDGGNTWSAAVCTGCGTTSATWTYNWTSSTDGSRTIKSRATDSSSNVETPSAGKTVTVDVTVPTVINTDPLNGATEVGINGMVFITWSENVNCTTVNNTNITVSAGGLTKQYCFGAFAAFQTSGQSQGTVYTVTVSKNNSVRDLNGNAMAETTFSFRTVDQQAPTSSVTDPANGTTLTSVDFPKIITGTASDNIGVTGVDISINGGAWTPATCTNCPGTNVNWTYSWTLPSDGSYTIQSRATDSATNVETPGTGNAITVDTINECSVNNGGCDPLTICTNHWGAAPTCGACPEGYSGDGYTGCTDDDECTLGTDNCDINAACTNTPGSFTCACNAGYSGDGMTCTDITAPTITSTVPADLANGVTLDSNVTINWSENVNCLTVNTTNITSDNPGWTLSTCSGSQAVFTTSGQANNTTYTVTVTTAVTDANGNAITASYAFSYTTQ